MKDYQKFKINSLYYLSFLIIIPIFLHKKWVKYINENSKLLLNLKNQMRAMSKIQQNEIKEIYLENISYFSSKKDHILLKDYISFQLDLKDMQDFLFATDRLMKMISYHQTLLQKIKIQIINSIEKYNDKMNLYRSTYLTIYVKVEQKFKKYPKKNLFQIKKFKDKKIW